MEIVIGYTMRIGLIISIMIVLVGGILYLVQFGNQPIHYQVFDHHTSSLMSVSGIVRKALNLSSIGLIQFGLLVLVLTQVIRVLLTAVLFIKQRDYIFIAISLGIFFVLVYSIFWRG